MALWILLVLACWITAFLPLPAWLSALLTMAILFFGSVFLVMGAVFAYWDSHMQPSQSGAMAMAVTGGLMLLSRLPRLLRAMLE